MFERFHLLVLSEINAASYSLESGENNTQEVVAIVVGHSIDCGAA